MFTQRILIVLAIVMLTTLSSNVISQASQSNLPDYPTAIEPEPTTPPQILNNGNMNLTQQEFEKMRMMMQRNTFPENNINRVDPQERIRQMQQMAQEQEELAMRQALRIDERQWRTLKPKIEKVKKYKQQAEVSIGMPFSSSFTSTSNNSGGQGFSGGFQVGFGGGGFGSTSIPNANQVTQSMTKGERICHELQMLLDSMPASGQTQTMQRTIQAKIKELQQARAEAKKQLEKAQEELRKGLDFNLQARLILLGLLD